MSARTAKRKAARAAAVVADGGPVAVSMPASDGLVNLVAKVGLGAANQLSAGKYAIPMKFTQGHLEAMYRTSWVVGKVVDAVAKDMTRAGIEIDGCAKPGDAKRLTSALSRLGVWRGLLNALRWSRLYGGAVLFLVIDGQDPSTPLDPNTVGPGQFRGVRVYDRHQLQPDVHQLVLDGPNAGTPRFYRVVANQELAPSGLVLHHSRVVRLIGCELPAWQAVYEEWWGASIVERMFDRLLAFDTGTMGAANLLTRAYLRTIGVDGLRDILAAGNDAEQNLMTMFNLMGVLQSTEGVTLIDKEDSFATHSYSFAGLDDILLSFGQQVSGATGIPLVKLFGQAPAGLNATGDADVRNYYDDVSAQQENDLRDGIETILAVLHRSVIGGPPPPGFEFTFAPLWQMSATEKAAHAGALTTALVAAAGAGFIDRATALEELRAGSEENGVYATITDEQIEQARLEEAPVPPGLGPESAVAALEAFAAGGALPGAGPGAVPGAVPGGAVAALEAFVRGGAPPVANPEAGVEEDAAPSALERVQEFGRPSLLDRLRAFVRG